MATKWQLLEPWRRILRDSSIQEEAHATESSLKVSFTYPDRHLTMLKTRLRLPADEQGQRDATKLQRLREAMELFTMLSFVDNKVFTELLQNWAGIQVTQNGDHLIYFPAWKFQLVLAPNNGATPGTEVTWGTLLGFPNDPREYSSEFRAAAQTLEAMGVEESTKSCVRGGSSISWMYKLQDSRLDGEQEPVRSADTSTSVHARLRQLFDVSIPPIVQLCVSRGSTCAWGSPGKIIGPCKVVLAAIDNWDHPVVSELAIALARTDMRYLSLSLHAAPTNSRQVMINAGNLLNTLVCGTPSTRLVTGNCRTLLRIPVRIRKMTLWSSKVCTGVFAAICSAVAELSANTHLSSFHMELEGSGRWPWLMYALCCGTSAARVPAIGIDLRGALTRSDILAISAVLETNYPQPMMKSNGEGPHVYGFVDIREGTELYPTGVDGDNDVCFVSSSGCRCRALYDATDSVSWVNVVVPGYGICRAELGEELKFIPDSDQPVFREKKRVCGSLAITGGTFETPAVLMELLTLVTRGLRLLLLYGDEEDDVAAGIHIDLCALSSACPELQDLFITKYKVAVSAHDESLRRWPIKTINLPQHSGTLSDLTGCLRNPKLRVARELIKLEVTAYRCVFDVEEMRELNAFDGAFLPVIKEKLPKSSKAALISVVTSACNATKPINCLDVYILSLIFVFASTPEERSVECYC